MVHNTLAVFAPELRGQWGFVPVPWSDEEDGTINRTVPVNLTQLTTGNATAPQGTTGSIIMEKSEKKEQAWEFLKWWFRADTQVRFGREMEALIGAASRWPTANVEAMLQLPWNVEERRPCWSSVLGRGSSLVLGGYYVTRQFALAVPSDSPSERARQRLGARLQQRDQPRDRQKRAELGFGAQL